MGANWKPTLFGLIAGIAAILSEQGVTIAPIGKSNLVALIGAISVFLLGYFSKSKEVTGGTVANDVGKEKIKL